MSNQTLHLRILDMDRLANGGPLEAVLDSDERLTVGRDSGADWPLPDQRRFISGRHLEFRYENDAWWMHDLSTNGTFVNGASTRVESPYRLTSGDRLQIGHYTMAVTVVGDLGMGDDAWDDDATVVSTVTPRVPDPQPSPQISAPPQAATPPAPPRRKPAVTRSPKAGSTISTCPAHPKPKRRPTPFPISRQSGPA
jgi:type VI secretion system protein ImpI